MGFLAVAFFACGGRESRAASPSEPQAPPAPAAAVAFTTLAQTAVPGQNGLELREVIRDTATWNQIWASLRQGSALPAAAPAVDFTKDMVLVAALPTQSCVSQVTIRSITGDATNLRVDLLEEPASPDCKCITAQRPFHAVRLARSEGAVQFFATVTPKGCSPPA